MKRWVFAFFLVLSSIVWAASPVNWSKADIKSKASIDHSRFQQFIAHATRTCEKSGKQWQDFSTTSADELSVLSSYIDDMQDITIADYNREQQRAFWVNVYNAKAILSLINYYDETSKKSKHKKQHWNKYQATQLFTVQKHTLNVDEIKNTILRPLWRDPRLHYALFCVENSCPSQAIQVMTGEASHDDLVLARAAKTFVNSGQAVLVDDRSRVRVSPIYSTYKQDFAPYGGVVSHLKSYAQEDLVQTLQQLPKGDKSLAFLRNDTRWRDFSDNAC